MEFPDYLKKLLDEVPDAWGVGICGMDGLVVEMLDPEGRLNASALAAEISLVFKGLDRNGEGENVRGNVTGLSVDFCDGTVFAEKLNPDYFVFLRTGSHVISGRARFMLRKSASGLAGIL